MKIQIVEGGCYSGSTVVIGERSRFNHGYRLKHIQTAIRRLHSGKPFFLASPIYVLSRQEIAALLNNAEQILNHKG